MTLADLIARERTAHARFNRLAAALSLLCWGVAGLGAVLLVLHLAGLAGAR
jgi:hypothetical protein